MYMFLTKFLKLPSLLWKCEHLCPCSSFKWKKMNNLETFLNDSFSSSRKGKDQINSPNTKQKQHSKPWKEPSRENSATRISRRTLLINEDPPFSVIKTYKRHRNILLSRTYFSKCENVNISLAFNTLECVQKRQ